MMSLEICDAFESLDAPRPRTHVAYNKTTATKAANPAIPFPTTDSIPALLLLVTVLLLATGQAV